MSNEDQTLNCRDCQSPFVFTAGEQKFFAERQFTPPTRCKTCRQRRKQAKEAETTGGTYHPSGGFSTGYTQHVAASAGGDGRRQGGRRRRDDHGSYEE